ncbi:pyridoxal-phosphate dependent enzyme family [Stipitochalara longipes BDJ]|nr:pyridoxal-phosphate dependent enzyme family [Stipitochalara longipes BDJ]
MPSVYINTSPKHINGLKSRNPKIRIFHESLPHYRPTPLVSLPEIAQQLGIRYLLVKDESSRLGLTAFKILGASWATARAVAKHVGLESKADPGDFESELSLQNLASVAQNADLVLYAATDGNHGRAVGRMAKYLGIKARIFVPAMVDEEAMSKIRSEGATVEVINGDYDQTVIFTKLAAEKHEGGKGLLISDTALDVEDEIPQWIVEGYQTMFDEIEEQIIQATGQNVITHIVTPVGAGSLASSVVTHFERTSRSAKPTIVTVEPESAACLKASLEAGTMTSVHATYTICTGMCCGTLSASVWPILKDGVSIATTVNDAEVDQAIHTLQKYSILAGPCGAASLAAIGKLAKEEDCHLVPDSVVIVLCTEGKRGYQFQI